MALDGNGRWCYLDPRLGAMHAVAEAARNVACAGATPVGGTNCLNFGNPEKPHIMWQFSQVIDGITKACEELETPITGGNVSFYNETLGEGIYPTPVLGIVGILEDVHKAVRPDFREPGRAIVLLRGTEPGDATDAQSQNLDLPNMPRKFWARSGDILPRWSWKKRPHCRRRWWRLPKSKLWIRPMTAPMAESRWRWPSPDSAKGIGMNVDLTSPGCRRSLCCSARTPAGWSSPATARSFGRIQQVAVKYGIAAESIGETAPERIEIKLDGRAVVSAAISELREVYEGALEKALRTERGRR